MCRIFVPVSSTTPKAIDAPAPQAATKKTVPASASGSTTYVLNNPTYMIAVETVLRDSTRGFTAHELPTSDNAEAYKVLIDRGSRPQRRSIFRFAHIRVSIACPSSWNGEFPLGTSP